MHEEELAGYLGNSLYRLKGRESDGAFNALEAYDRKTTVEYGLPIIDYLFLSHQQRGDRYKLDRVPEFVAIEVDGMPVGNLFQESQYAFYTRGGSRGLAEFMHAIRPGNPVRMIQFMKALGIQVPRPTADNPVAELQRRVSHYFSRNSYLDLHGYCVENGLVRTPGTHHPKPTITYEDILGPTPIL